MPPPFSLAYADAVAKFNGFPVAALDFYDDLEMDNSKSFWEAHKTVYAEAVKEPMTALTCALEPEFGKAKVFRPYRDVRFAKDKTPYKTHQGAFVGIGPATGWYIQLGAAGVRVGAGFYEASSARLSAIRAGIDNELTGVPLERILDGLRSDGWQIGGDRLKTTPRGYDASHPRIEILRHKSITVGKDYGFGEEIQRPDLVERVREDWREARPLLDWLTDVAAGTE